MSSRDLVLSYVNPDTDGISCTIGYAFLADACGDRFRPVYFGQLNPETILVTSKYFNCDFERLETMPVHGRVVLVDTHQLGRLPVDLSPERVIEIIDHHPVGEPQAFPNAKIQNEPVGAAATLITERLIAARCSPSADVAGLLCSGIVSNTVNFSAPSTTDRDRAAFKWLCELVEFDQSIIEDMFNALLPDNSRSTIELLAADYKEFKIGDRVFGMSQIETANARSVMERSDLCRALAQLRQLGTSTAEHVIANVVDVVRGESVIAAGDAETKAWVEQILGAESRCGVLIVPRVVLRKTDLVPGLRRLLEKA